MESGGGLRAENRRELLKLKLIRLGHLFAASHFQFRFWDWEPQEIWGRFQWVFKRDAGVEEWAS